MQDIKSIMHKMETEKNQTGKEHQEALDKTQEMNEKAIAEVSEQFKAKLIVEYQKYDNLEDMYNGKDKIQN
jgi:2-succinyl-5-enolpyruvyl-6-hydroxy-3-cyclohexene-1-carboxylate synthase